MSYIALYREWRPSVFEDVVEQEHVVKTLRHSVSTGRIAHAYLFCGTRGTGKTTMAHILSRAINCLSPINGDPCNSCEICREILSGSGTDVLEIDAASNNSVDNVREIRDEVVYAPSRAKYKVYIIDEVHMLSTGAFNALLKTLEEPPPHVVFILATTEPHKLPATILSRCQRFDFRRISPDSIVKRLEKITDANGVSLEESAARLIAKLSEGALRDAISLLDQCMSSGNAVISYQDVLTVVGMVTDIFMEEIADGLIARDTPGMLGKVARLVADGRDIPHFISDLVMYFRNLLICSVTSDPSEAADVPADVLEVMKRQCGKISKEEIIYVIKELSSLESGLKWAASPRVLLEVTLVKLCEKGQAPVSGDVLERLAAIENRLNNGALFSQSSAGRSDIQAALTAEPISGSSHAAASGIVPLSGAANKPVGSIHGGSSAGLADNSAGQEHASSPGQTHTSGPRQARKAEREQLEKWPEVLDYLKRLGRRTVHSYLLGTRAVRLEAGNVGIVFDSGHKFQKTLIAKLENLEVVEEAAGKVLGGEVKIVCLDEESLDGILHQGNGQQKDDLVEKGRALADRAGVPLEITDD